MSERQSDLACELLVEMLRSREAARPDRGTGFRACTESLGVLRPAEEQCGKPPCACADLSRLKVEGMYASGSVPEGNDVHLQQPFSRSDADVMFQLGPVRGLEEPLQGHEGTASRPEEPLQGPDGPEGVLLTQESAGRPGFVLLRHRRRPDCGHPEPLLFSPSSAVRLLAGFGLEAADGRPDRQSRAGPSVAVDFYGQYDVDLVACVECPVWPSAEFASRRRPSGWPAPALVDRLCGTAAFLVPVGCPGSATQTDEWRLSFSRHEHTALRDLTPEQRACLTALKYCKALLGRSVAAVKSYYLKTALLWLCERHGADWWTGAGAARRTLLAMLQWVEEAARAGRLPVYFWPEVDALGGRRPAERRRLERHTARLRRHLLAAVVVLCASRLLQWQRQDAVPADLVPCLNRFLGLNPATDGNQLPASAYRTILKGNRITLRKLQKMIQREQIWPDEESIVRAPINMDHMLAGYLLVNHGPRGVTSPRPFLH